MARKSSTVQKISVVVATYNRAAYLRLCLSCLAEQDWGGNWEIVVADDGSQDETPRVVEEVKAKGLPILHAWQEDQGYRRSSVLNLGAKASSGDLLVFIDSDCIPVRHLLSAYAARAAPNSFYLGGVWKLNEAATQKALSAMAPADFFALAADPSSHIVRQRRRFLKRYLKTKCYRFCPWTKPKIWGGNFAVNRDVFEAVNGFDENYKGWGQEDSDLRNRLVRAGVRAYACQRTALVYHLWHPKDMSVRVGPDGERPNWAYYRRKDVPIVCKNGLRKLL